MRQRRWLPSPVIWATPLLPLGMVQVTRDTLRLSITVPLRLVLALPGVLCPSLVAAPLGAPVTKIVGADLSTRASATSMAAALGSSDSGAPQAASNTHAAVAGASQCEAFNGNLTFMARSFLLLLMGRKGRRDGLQTPASSHAHANPMRRSRALQDAAHPAAPVSPRNAYGTFPNDGAVSIITSMDDVCFDEWVVN
jgi:hypothetical protein